MQNQSLSEKYALVNGLLQNYFMPVFTPVQRGRRAKAMIRTYKNKDKTKTLEVAMFEQLDVADQDLFLSILSMCNSDSEFLEADELLDADGHIRGMQSIKIETTAYELLLRTGRKAGGQSREWLKKSLLRLSRTSLRFDGKRSSWSVNLLNFSFKKDDQGKIKGLSVWVNPVAALVFAGNAKLGYTKHSLDDRLSLKNEASKVLHSYFNSMIRVSGSRVFKIETLIEHVYLDSDDSDRVVRSRKEKIKNALKLINKLRGWTVEIERNNVKIFRARNSK